MIKQKNILNELAFELDKKAFEGPFRCCSGLTTKSMKKINYHGIEFSYDVWKCRKCQKEYLDTEQAKRLERFWTVQRLLNDKLISIERHINFDGKTHFFRFPTEFTKNWGKHSMADIKIINPETYLVEIKH